MNGEHQIPEPSSMISICWSYSSAHLGIPEWENNVMVSGCKQSTLQTKPGPQESTAKYTIIHAFYQNTELK